MKPYKITLYLFSVIAVLTILCAVFPPDGIRLSGTTLTFPSLAEVLSPGESEETALPEESPEELLARQLENMRMQEREQYLTYFRESNIRFNLPNDDFTWFDDLFEAFENSDSSRVRIVHYGDSQIEGDRITGVIREELQETFGGIGPGILPVIETVGSINTGLACSAELRRALAYGPAEARARGGNYGPMAQVAYLDTFVVVSVWPRIKEKKHCRKFTRVTLLADNISSKLYVTCKGDRRVIDPTKEMTRITFQFPDSLERVSLSMSGYANLYGIMLDGESGVSVDNIAMRGCSGAMFTSINRNHLSDYYQKENVRLILLEYGGNSVPYLKTEKNIHTYAETMGRQIRYLQQQAPQAKILFIGPSDMSTRLRGAWQTYPMLPAIIDSLRTTANRAGAAYWDMYQVMGGHNSMAQWCGQNPPLAGPDHIHFTMKGGERVADLFCKSLMLYYDYYRWRKPKEEGKNQELEVRF